MMAQGHRLRRLQVSKAGHDGMDVFLRAVDQDRLQRLELGIQAVNGIPDPEPEVGGYLIVPGTRRVEASGGLADQFTQA